MISLSTFRGPPRPRFIISTQRADASSKTLQLRVMKSVAGLKETKSRRVESHLPGAFGVIRGHFVEIKLSSRVNGKSQLCFACVVTLG